MSVRGILPLDGQSNGGSKLNLSLRVYLVVGLLATSAVVGLLSIELQQSVKVFRGITDVMNRAGENIFVAQSIRRNLTAFRRQDLLTEIEDQEKRLSNLSLARKI